MVRIEAVYMYLKFSSKYDCLWCTSCTSACTHTINLFLAFQETLQPSYWAFVNRAVQQIELSKVWVLNVKCNLVSDADLKPTPAWNAFNTMCYTGSDIRTGWGLGTRLKAIMTFFICRPHPTWLEMLPRIPDVLSPLQEIRECAIYLYVFFRRVRHEGAHSQQHSWVSLWSPFPNLQPCHQHCNQKPDVFVCGYEME